MLISESDRFVSHKQSSQFFYYKVIVYSVRKLLDFFYEFKAQFVRNSQFNEKLTNILVRKLVGF